MTGYSWRLNEGEVLTKIKELSCQSIEVRKYMVCSGVVRSSIFMLFINYEKWKTDEVKV